MTVKVALLGLLHYVEFSVKYMNAPVAGDSITWLISWYNGGKTIMTNHRPENRFNH